jgi:hypothetical protein
MSSLTINPSIDQAALQNFMDSFHELAQQTKSHLVATRAIKFMPSKGKTNNMARIGRVELVEVNTRNPDKQYGDYNVDNRQFSKRRFTKTITIDAKHDINELIKDPTSDILKQLNNAKERVIDRIGINAAVGAVLTGAPDAAPTSTSAATDGVLTITATSGFVYGTVQQITQNFINNDVPYDTFSGATICITGKENTDLMGETEFINNFYISGKPVEQGVMEKAGAYRVQLFAGSVNGGITVVSPILPEGVSTRSCVVLAPESIAMSMELADLSVTKSATKVNSWDITIDFWINAMRTEGVLVQIVTTTL